MVNFIEWVFDSFYSLFYTLVFRTVEFISQPFGDIQGEHLSEFNINLVLFSETPILSIDLYDLLILFFSVFYGIIFVVIVYKIIKKVFAKITGWKKW